MKQNGQENRLDPQDGAFHDWYRFVLAYPPHLVGEYLTDFGIGPGQVVLDPFCGTGTTLIEAKLAGVPSAGIEANPFAFFASTVKVDWAVNPVELKRAAQEIADSTIAQLAEQGIDDSKPFGGKPQDLPLRTLDAVSTKLLITDSVSPIPLHKTLVLLDCLRAHQRERYYQHALLALANALVFTISNLRFGPEVGIGKTKPDVPVLSAWLSEVTRIAQDLSLVAGKPYPQANVYLTDARQASGVIAPNSIDAVITSPPYPNEKDYTRTTRLESVILGLITSKAELRTFKKQLIRSNTRVVYKGDDDDQWIAGNAEIERIAGAIEQRRIELGKTSGFERLYGKVTKLYFGGMARHLADLRTVLRPGANLAYVVGDQASYLRVMIRTGQLLAEVAEGLGYELLRIDLFRTRFSTATREQLREEVVVLKWPGYKRGVRMSPRQKSRDAEAVEAPKAALATPNRYYQLILEIWQRHYTGGEASSVFPKKEFADAAQKLEIPEPDNLSDLLYYFRYRMPLPKEIVDQAPEGMEWAINPAGKGKYRFELIKPVDLTPNPMLLDTKIPDATPGVISMYALSDEQALLAKLRYNRLIDVFTRLTCYHLQSHLRTYVKGKGQSETDDIYIGLDNRGAHYVLPVQAKGGKEKFGIVQIASDFAVCQSKWPNMVCRAIAAQFMSNDVIALFEFAQSEDRVGIVAEKHYRLVPPDELTPLELATYRSQSE